MNRALRLLGVLVVSVGCSFGPALPPLGPAPEGLVLAFTATTQEHRDEFYVDQLGRLSLARRVVPVGRPGAWVQKYLWDETGVLWDVGEPGTVEHVVSWDSEGLLHRFWTVATPTAKGGPETAERFSPQDRLDRLAVGRPGASSDEVQVVRGAGAWGTGTLLARVNGLLVALSPP